MDDPMRPLATPDQSAAGFLAVVAAWLVLLAVAAVAVAVLSRVGWL